MPHQITGVWYNHLRRSNLYAILLRGRNRGDVRITPEMVKEHERMLTGGFYAEVTLGYDSSIAQEKGGRPFGVDSLRAIQLSQREVLEVLTKGRTNFTTAECCCAVWVLSLRA